MQGLTNSPKVISLKLKIALRKFTLLRTTVTTLVLKISAAGLGFVNSILLARLLGPAEFGVYSIVMSIVNFAATLTMLGFPTLATREAAAMAEHEKWNCLRGFLRAAHLWMVLAIFAILGTTAFLLASGIVKPIVSWHVMLVAMILVPIIAFNQLRAAILRGLYWVVLADIPDLLLRPFVMLLLLAGAFFVATSASATHALTIQLTACGFALIVGSWWLTTKQPTALRTAKPEYSQGTWLLSALPFLGVALLNILDGQVSLYLLGYLGDSRQAGLFQAASLLVGLIAIGLAAVNTPLQPRLAAAWARNEKTEVQCLITETARMSMGIALPGVLILLFFAETVLRLYGVQYVEAAQALRILAIGQIVNAAAGSCGVLLLMTGHQRVVMQGTVLALLLNVVVAYLAIPRFGVVGGALAATLGMISWNVFYATYALFGLGLNTTILNILRAKVTAK